MKRLFNFSRSAKQRYSVVILNYFQKFVVFAIV